MKSPWLDTHIHLSDIGRDHQRREHMLDDLLELMDRDDTAELRFVVSCDDPYIGAMKTDPEQMLAGNRMIYNLVRQAPDRLYGSCTINPNYLDESLRVMKICFEEWGFVQLGEMLQYVMHYEMDSASAEQCVRRAVDFAVPVQVHLGTNWTKDRAGSSNGMRQMGELMRLADRVPEARFVLAHAIGVAGQEPGVPWAKMYLDALATIYAEYPRNFWIEIRDFQSPLLPRVMREIPTDHVLAGTDWTTRIGPPFQSYGTMFGVQEAENPFSPRVASLVQFLRNAGASQEDMRRVAVENARSLYNLPS